MINSLNIDSHISKSSPQNFRLQTPTENVRQEKLAVNKNEIIKRETANVNFCGLSAKEAKNETKWIFRSKLVNSALQFAERNQLVFGATCSLVLTCLMRPLSIMLIPSDKKNKGDKVYASAHSIASGLIGFAITSIAFTPISDAVNRCIKDKEKYIKKDSPILKNPKALEIAETTINRIPDILGSIPKGILTISILVPILKYGFNIEKGKSNAKTGQKGTPDYSLLNFKNRVDKPSDFTSFKNQGGKN